MSLQPQDINRAANSLVADFGEEAKAEAERNIAGSMKAGYKLTAEIWKEVRTVIVQNSTNEAAKARSVGN